MCAICHGNIQPNDVALVRGCDHAFCSCCILNWALQKARCPLCLEKFTHVWLYRRLDGTYNDYLIEESVDLLHCAVWFKKAVTTEFMPQPAADDELPPPNEDDYHEMLQWMYGGAREAEETEYYYDDMQECLERGRRGGGGGPRAFGQRKWGSSGFVSGGGPRLAARAVLPKSPAPKYTKKGFAASSSSGGGGGGSSSSGGGGSSGTYADEAGASSSSAAGAGFSGAGGAGGVYAPLKKSDRKAEKQRLKEEQKEKRRNWALSG